MTTQGYGEQARGGPLRAWRPPKGSWWPYADVILKPFQVTMGWHFIGKVVVDCRGLKEGFTPKLRNWIDTSVRTRMIRGAYLDVWTL